VDEARDDWTRPVSVLGPTLAKRRARDIEARAQLDALSRSLFPEGDARPLPPLASGAGVVGVLWTPTENGWATFVAGDGGARATTSADAPTAESLLAAVARDLPSLRRLRLMPAGKSREIDFHAALLDGVPLGARAVVEYAIDAPPPPRASVIGPALVVADATESLPEARSEGEDVVARYRAQRDARLLLGPEATRAAVLAGLEGAALFHFAGHAAYAGVDGWESALLLANGDRLTAADVLALSHAPPIVVLSGCQTGREGDARGAQGIGLGAAFLAAGSRAVLASTRDVSDATTARLMHELSIALSASPDDPAAALQKAQNALRSADPSADWSAFRAFVR
jgi:hypothetical protein